jgi:hypothetical protein
LRHNFSAWWYSRSRRAFVHWAITVGELCIVDFVWPDIAREAEHIAHAAGGVAVVVNFLNAAGCVAQVGA